MSRPRIGVTGDSAGGHLAAAASLMTDKIGSGGFGRAAGVFEFMPTYLPNNKTVEQVRAEMLAAIKAAAPSSAAFGMLLSGAMPAWSSASGGCWPAP